MSPEKLKRCNYISHYGPRHHIIWGILSCSSHEWGGFSLFKHCGCGQKSLRWNAACWEASISSIASQTFSIFSRTTYFVSDEAVWQLTNHRAFPVARKLIQTELFNNISIQWLGIALNNSLCCAEFVFPLTISIQRHELMQGMKSVSNNVYTNNSCGLLLKVLGTLFMICKCCRPSSKSVNTKYLVQKFGIY